MIRALFRLLFRLVALAVIVSIFIAVWIVFDGLNDQGDRADVAVVPGMAVRHSGIPSPILRARLDRAIEFYRAGKFPLIIVSGATELGGYDEATAMSNYLVEKQVPVSAIIQDKLGTNTRDTGRDVAAIMRTRGLHSVMIISQYYHITRMKLALEHAGVPGAALEQAHVGVVQKEDAFMLAREVLAMEDYLFKFYLLPFADKAKAEAQVQAEKLKADAEKAKSNVQHKIDNLPK